MLRLTFRRRLAAGAVPLVSAALVLGSTAAASASVGGPDVASYQHPSGRAINWSSVYASGKRFVFVKATEGTAYRNPYFAGDWADSHAAGLLHGAYHFARPNGRSGSAAAQARAFVAAAGTARAQGDLPPTLDLEVTGGLGPAKLIAWTTRWLSTVQTLTGRKAMIYSYPYFWAHNMRGTTSFRDHRLWGASYGSQPTTFGGAWTTWTFWQYSSTSNVSGIRAKSDMNTFHGTLTQLRALANIRSTSTTQPPVATPPTTPVPAPTTPTTPKPATQSKATAVSIHAPATASGWHPFDISGRLTRNGNGVAGQQVRLSARIVGHDHWFDVGAVTTDTAGRWQATVRAPDDVQLQALFGGTSRLTASHSRIATVAITGSGYWHH
jgi:GH25 family lysozyme M1 (1,4-beta-N-acetylmuramidase)